MAGHPAVSILVCLAILRLLESSVFRAAVAAAVTKTLDQRAVAAAVLVLEMARLQSELFCPDLDSVAEAALEVRATLVVEAVWARLAQRQVVVVLEQLLFPIGRAQLRPVIQARIPAAVLEIVALAALAVAVTVAQMVQRTRAAVAGEPEATPQATEAPV